MSKIVLLLPLALLAACQTGPVKDDTTVLVPVSAPCVQGQRPVEVKALKETMTKEQWDTLSTDQREKLLLANAADRKAYGDQLFVVTAGCR
jgi:hypothetical protein